MLDHPGDALEWAAAVRDATTLVQQRCSHDSVLHAARAPMGVVLHHSFLHVFVLKLL